MKDDQCKSKIDEIIQKTKKTNVVNGKINKDSENIKGERIHQVI